jgi:hypothetical protein
MAVLDVAIEAVCAHANAGIGTYFDQAEARKYEFPLVKTWRRIEAG